MSIRQWYSSISNFDNEVREFEALVDGMGGSSHVVEEPVDDSTMRSTLWLKNREAHGHHSQNQRSLEGKLGDCFVAAAELGDYFAIVELGDYFVAVIKLKLILSH
ncbi:hypothetical protein SLEP1_g18182 [Rubroshorea leprosula]|uniref:Uncharacterized protein n=1 Tax=Rubroshorea leprosula TaxID=152421 RepID=A0AAV5J2K5_9ROSI|nr:hypothetical protein SLEP1_g18182 [Rubroshorea leprosula]